MTSMHLKRINILHTTILHILPDVFELLFVVLIARHECCDFVGEKINLKLEALMNGLFPQTIRRKSINLSFISKEHCHVIKNRIPFPHAHFGWRLKTSLFIVAYATWCFFCRVRFINIKEELFSLINLFMVCRPEMEQRTQCSFTSLFKKTWHIPSIPCCLPLSGDSTHTYRQWGGEMEQGNWSPEWRKSLVILLKVAGICLCYFQLS